MRSCGLFPHFTRDGRTEDTGNCYTRPARNFALWPSVGLVVLPAAVSFRTLRRGARIEAGALSVSPEPTDAAVLVDRARNTFLSGGGRDNLNIGPAAGPSQGDGGASWATTRTTPHTSPPSLASATGCRGARRWILLNDDSAPARMVSSDYVMASSPPPTST